MASYKQAIKNKFVDEIMNSWGLEKLPPNIQYVVYLRDVDGVNLVVSPPTRISVLIMKHPEIGGFEICQIQLIAQCYNGCILETTLEGEDMLDLVEHEAWGMQKTFDRINAEYLEALFNTDENRT